MNGEQARRAALVARDDTVFGLGILPTAPDAADAVLRTALLELSEAAWYELFLKDRDPEDVQDGAEIVEGIFQESRQYNIDIVPPGEEPLTWYAQTDPAYWFEHFEEAWLSEDVWEGVMWTWPEVSVLAALVMVDLAVQALERGQTPEAGVWLYRAGESFGRGRLSAAPALDVEDTGALSRFGKRAAHIRHEPNRAAKELARRLYWERTWKSSADAARMISPKVHKVEGVVARWIREFRKDAAGRVPTEPAP
jgi:hypothetical protein